MTRLHLLATTRRSGTAELAAIACILAVIGVLALTSIAQGRALPWMAPSWTGPAAHPHAPPNVSLPGGGDESGENPAGQQSGASEPFAEEAIAAGVGLALLAGLVDDLQVGPAADGTGTVVRMSWPIG